MGLRHMQINISGDLHTGMTEGFRFGLLLIPITVIPMLFVIGNSENVVATVGLIVSFVNTVTLIVPIFFTEKALNKAFDKDGNRRAE